MDIQLDTVSQVRRRITFVIPASKVASALNAAAQRIAGKARVPGFRPGKVPLSMIERMYGTDVRRTALDKLLQDHVFAAIQQAQVQAVSQPEVESLGELKRDADLPVTVAVEVLPDIDVSGYEPPALQVEQVVADDADVEAALEARCRDRAELVPVTDAAGPGDEAVVDYVLTPQAEPEEGKPEPRPISAEQRRFTIGDGRVPPLVEEAVTGAKAGDRIEKTATVADDDGWFAAGTTVQVDITVHEVLRTEIPELDDALAVDLGFEDLNALRASTQTELEAEAARLTRDRRRRAAVDALLTARPIEVPPALLDRFVDDQMARMFGNMPQQQARALRQALAGMRDTLVRDTEAAMSRSLVLEAVATEAKLEVGDAEIDAEIEQLVGKQPQRAELVRRQYAQADARDELRRRLLNEKAMDHLASQASIETTGTKSLAEARAEKTSRDVDVKPRAVAPQPVHVHGPDCDHDHDHGHGAHDAG